MKKFYTRKFMFYFVRLIFRGLIFLGAVYIYFFHKNFLLGFVAEGFFQSFGIRNALWIVLMVGMVIHLIPKSFITLGGLKSREYTYVEPKESYDKAELYRFVQVMNIKAWKVMLLWLCLNAIFAVLYLCHVIGEAEMLLLTFFYFLSDIICMLIFCPFQSWIMKNRCCVNCRIFDWGHFMMYTPMIFIKSFFSWSLFFTACIVLLRWEVSYATHPERFWHGSNCAIRCENCTDKMCQIKEPLREIYRHISENIRDYFE